MLNPLGFDGVFVGHIACVGSGLGLQHHDPDLFVGHRHMLHAFRDDDELALTDGQILVAQLDGQRAFDHEEQLVFVLMVMPDEFALHPGDLDVGAVQFTGDFGVPLLAEEVEFFGQVDDFGHWDSFLYGGLSNP